MELVTSLVSRCVLPIGFVGYCLIGTKIFQALEKDSQVELKNSFFAARKTLMNNYANITPEELENFLQLLTYIVKHGVTPTTNGASYINWDFQNSLSFVTSTLSTIGYGSVTPRTPMGQIFCMFYALLGIPLNIIFLKFAGNTLSQPFSGLWKYLHNRGLKERKIKIYTLLFFLVSGLFIFILLPPLIFMRTEGWSYNEGVYFAFISLSTIGFGDYVVGVNSHENYPKIYMALIILWCIFGLTWIALLFNLFSKLLDNTETKITCNLLHQTKST